MPTYYEVLQLVPTASSAEIEAACDAQYHHWRRLVTHHDPSVVNQANQTLQLLETIRTTLTHPERRMAYDARLQAGRGVVGGLGDPAAVARPGVMVPPPPPPAPVAVTPPPPALERVDAWLCPKCQTANAPGNAYCKQCGHTIGIHCPKCSIIIEASAAFCSHCGVNVANAARQKELEAALTTQQQALVAVERPIPDRAEEIKTLRRAAISAGAWLIWVIAGLFWLYSSHLPVAHPSLSMVLGVQVVALVGLVIVQRAFSFSAFLAGLLFVGDFLLGGNVIYHRPVYAFYAVDPIGAVVLSVYVLALLNIGARLRKYQRGARLLVWGALLARMVSAVLFLNEMEFFAVLSIVQPVLGDGVAVLQSTELPLFLDSMQMIVLCILTLRAWWLALHFAHEVAAARLAQRQQVEQLQSEIWQITSELQSLGRQ